ncbi:hypothetical protein B0H17DRAFT_1015264 [Mycena rosella]|uniref:F-box domain-containing protein n=1 Tax=Mycena rosella TaxID=1033263 RepID=A0AAD7G9E1_MYCRO|nr:hypothetical protein B0H17DRAFT_1015264 [Mycena rosella]
MTTVDDPQAPLPSQDGPPYNLQATELPELLGPDYLHQSCAEIPGIPPNWNESWSILRATLETLEESGMTPYAAVLGLLHVEAIRQQDLILESLAVGHLEDHLGTNYVPSFSERKQIQEFCAVGSQKISKVIAEIEIDRYRLISSNGRRVALHERVDPYLALISPMRAVPPEILQEIFMACLPGDHNAIMHTSEAPLLLGRVCSDWRAISLSTAALWASVHLVIPTPTLHPSHIIDEEPPPDFAITQRNEGLRIWLQRSGECLLSISLFNASSWGMLARQFLDTVIIHSHRLRALALIQIPSQDLEGLCSLAPTDVPALEVVEIVDNTWGVPNSTYMHFYSIPPNLHTLSLQRNSGQRLPTCSWHRITNLHLQSHVSFYTPDIEQTMDLVQQCVNLQRCQLKFPTERQLNYTAYPASPPRRVTLLHLYELWVQGASAVDVVFNLAHIVDRFTVPSVKQLTVWNLHTPETPILDPPVFSDTIFAIEQLVERSSCSLNSLSLHQVMGDVECLLECLRRSPGLTHLRLLDDANHPIELLPVLTELIARPASCIPPLCPSLTHLRLGNVDATDAYHPVLQKLIESRCGEPPSHTTRLKWIDVILRHPSSLQTTVEPWRFSPSSVYIAEPYDYRQDYTDRSRWGGIPNNNLGAEIWG